MENLYDEFNPDEMSGDCAGCQCVICNNSSCPVKCKAHVGCDNIVTRCEDYK